MIMKKRINKYLLTVILLLQVIPVFADYAGRQWLISQLQADGSTQSEHEYTIATAQQATAATVGYYIYDNYQNSIVTNSINYLVRNHLSATENVAELAVLQHLRTTLDPSLISDLNVRINLDGGAGQLPGFESTVLDSAFALYGLSITDETYEQTKIGLLNYILSQMKEDGSFEFQINDTSSLYISLMVLRAMNANMDISNHYRQQYELIKEHIISMKGSDSGWGSMYETALAISLLEDSDAYYAEYWDAIVELRNSRLANHSWDNDVFTTAWALQALHKSNQYQEPDGLAVISGRVVDSLTQSSINLSYVTLDGGEVYSSDSFGYFSLDQLLPGEHALVVSAPGYLDQSFNLNLSENQNLTLGNVLLLKKPNIGVISGQVIAYETQQALNNVMLGISGANVAETITDVNGMYSFELQPGDYTITATLNGRDQIIANFNIQNGQQLNFSPQMYLTGATPWITSTDIHGRLIDAADGSPIFEASILVDGTSITTQSNQEGYFELLELETGEINLTITANDYQDVNVSIISNGDLFNIGDIALSPINEISSSRLFGQIRDLNSQSVLYSAEIEILNENLVTYSDQSGNYVIEDIPVTNYTVRISAAGYIPRTIDISSLSHMNTQLNVDLVSSNNQNLIINEFLPEQFLVTQEGPLGLEIEVQNTGYSAYDSLMYVEVYNESDDLIDRFPINEGLVGNVIQAIPITVPRLGAVQLSSNWDHHYLAAGFYRLDLLLYDSDGVNLLAERSVEVEVKSYQSMAGKMIVNPQATVFNNDPVSLRAEILNSGNLPIDGGEITTKVYLNQKLGPNYENDILASYISSPLINSDTLGMVKSEDGKIFIAKGSEVLKIDSNGDMSVFATGFSAAKDVELGSDGNLYVLDSSRRGIVELDQSGVEIQFLNFSISSSNSFKLIEDEFLISSSIGLYRFNPNTLEVETVTENQMKYPSALAVNNNDELFILDGYSSGGSSVFKNSENTTSSYSDELNHPTGIIVEPNGDLIISNRNSDEVVRIDTNKNKHVITDQIPFPEGITKAINGNYLVTSLNDQVWEVTASGVVTPASIPAIGYPKFLTRDDSGGFYSFNDQSKLIYHFDSSHHATLFNNTTFNSVVDLHHENNSLWVAESQAIHRINTDNSIDSFTTGITDVSAITFDKINGNVLFLSKHFVKQLDPNTGQVADYVEPFLFNAPKALSQSSNGVKIISSKGQILNLKNDLTYESFANIVGDVKDMYEDSNGNTYVALADKSIYSIDSASQTTLVATAANRPEQIVVDSFGSIYYTNNTNTIYKIEAGVESALSPLSFNIISEIELDDSDNLWVANNRSAGVIAKYDLTLEISEEYSIPNSLQNHLYPHAIHFTNSNEVIVGVRGGLIKFNGTEFSDFVNIPELAGSYILFLEKASNGNYWLQNSNDEILFISEQGGVIKQTVPTTLYNSSYPQDLVSFQGKVSIAHRGGVLQYSDHDSIPDIVDTNEISDLAVDESGDIYMASNLQRPKVYKYDRITSQIDELFSYDRYLSGLEVSSDSSIVFTSTNYYKNLIGIWDSNGNLEKHYSSIIDPNQIYTDHNTGETYLMANSNNDILKLNENGLAEIIHFTSNGNYFIKDGSHIIFTKGNGIYRLNLLTGEINYELSDLNPGVFQGLSKLSNGNYVMVSDRGIYTFDGQIFSQVSGGLNSIIDTNSLSDGTPLVLSSAGHSSSVFKINADDSVSLLFPGLSLGMLSGGFSVFNDEIFLTAKSDKEIYKIDQTGELSIYGKIPSRSGIGYILAMNSSEMLVQDIYSNTSQSIYKAKLLNDESQYQAGDLIYSQSASYQALPVQGQKQEFDLGTFVPPVAGNYQITLESDNQNIAFITNEALHVGVLAEGQFSDIDMTVLPGDYDGNTSLSISGVNTVASMSLIPETKTTITPSFNDGRFVVDRNGTLVAIGRYDYYLRKYDEQGNPGDVIFDDFAVYYLNVDNEGYIHAKSNTQIVKLDTDGTVLQTTSLALINTNVHRHIDIDSQGNYWLSRGGTILNIEAGTGQVLDQISLDYTDYVVFVDENDNLILAGYLNILFYDTSTREVRVLVESYAMEGEGFNYDYACGHLLFAPTSLPSLFPDIQVAEEFYIAKINPEIGISQTIYDTRLVPFGLGEDIDSIHYNQANNRLYMFTDRALKQMEVNCGSLQVELHIELNPTVNISQSSIMPTEITVANNNEAWIWLLNDIDENSYDIDFALRYEDLLDGETRSAFKEAYLLYTNPLDQSQNIRIDLDIPAVAASSQKELNVLLDQVSYVTNTDVLISSEVVNNSIVAFDGFVTQIIETDSGQYVDHLSNLEVNGLSANSSITLDSTWSTAQFYAGNYKLVSELIDPSGDLHNRVETPFEIIVSDSGYAVEFNVLTNQSQYNTVDSVEINTILTNLATNAILEDSSLELTITAPDSSIQLLQNHPVNDLAPNASQQWQDIHQLNHAPVGEYTIKLDLYDVLANLIATEEITFEVLLDEQLVLAGDVSVDFDQIQPGTDNVCHFELINQSNESITGLPVELVVINLSNQLVMMTSSYQIDLGPGDSWQQDMTIPTNNLSSGDHACLIRTIDDGDTTTHGSATFIVSGANQISGMLFDDFSGDGILDNNDSGIESVELNLLDNNLNIIQTIQTGADGHYQFAPVNNGKYTVQVIESGVLVDAQITSGANSSTFNIENNHIQVDFGYQFSNSNIEGTIWDDINANGLVDLNENGFESVSIELLDSDLNLTKATSTDIVGSYRFEQITSGSYQLQITDNNQVLDGLRNTTSNEPLSLDVYSNSSLIGTNFGYRQDIFDLDVFTTNCTKGLKESQEITYLVQVRNLGNTDIIQATVENLVPLGLTNVTWTCETDGGATCGGSGTDDVLDLIDIPQGAVVNYMIDATVSGQLLDIITEEVNVSMPSGIVDDVMSNNQAFDSDMVLDLYFIDGFDCAAPTSTVTSKNELLDILNSEPKSQGKLMNYMNQQIKGTGE